MLSEARAESWRSQLGERWRLHLALLLALWLLAGLLRPIGDPDLPRHLALGEWILRHGVPFAEPWAWTRAGAPFFAYSWLPELAQYGAFRAGGEWGLRLYNGLLLLLAALSILVLARVAGWRPWTALLITLLHVGFATAVSGGQRPHIVLAITIPLAWAACHRLTGTERPALPLAALVALAALSANSHILFPLIAAPLAVLVATPGVSRARLALAAGAVVAGWLLSPYALVWPDVFRLNFAPNPLFAYPTPIGELTPGFTAVVRLRDTLGVFALALTLLPWVTSPVMRPRERLVHGVLWLAGLGLFAVAVRGIVDWWLITLPLSALALGRLREPTRAGVRRAQLAAIYAISVLFVLTSIRSDATMRRGTFDVAGALPVPVNPWVEPAIGWLSCHARPDASGKVFNSFDFGDYLAWRLPRYSVSIDGRNIFPDSVARAEALNLAAGGAPPLGPWRSADLAIVPRIYPVATVLDTATGWRPVLTSTDPAGEASVGIWVREAWWAAAGTSPLPPRADRIELRGSRPYECSR